MTRAFAAAVGAQEVTGSPVPGSLLNDGGPMGRSQDADMVVTTTWWLAPGKPQAELALAAARLRPAFDDGGSGTTGTDIRGDRFTLPPVAGLFNERTLDVSVTAAGHGQTAIRVDAVVGWIPPRPDGDTVPASARLATVTLSWLDPGKPGRPTTKTVTVTDQGRVRALAAYLDHQPVSPPVAYGCPAGMPGGVTVEFRARPAGPVLAKATGDGSGCGFVSYTMPGHPMTGIGGAGAAAALLAEVNRVAGVHWTFDKP
jgi:hypothetical protein